MSSVLGEIDDFRCLIRQVREGSENAAWEIVGRYGEVIRRAVRRALNSRLRSKFDSSDFVQFVWASFFRARDELDRFEDPDQLARFLVKMARNKVGMEVRRRLLTEKYNVNRELSLDSPPSGTPMDVPSRQPGPAEVAIARERWNRMLQGQPQHCRQIIQMRLQGYTYQAIADSLHIAESTVRRFLKRLSRETAA